MLRFFKGSNVVRLPRRLTSLALVTVIAAQLGVVLPYYLGGVVQNTLDRSVEQAASLSQLSGIYDLQGRRADSETEGLMLAGFEVIHAAHAESKRVWLITTPTPQAPVKVVDSTSSNIIARAKFVFWVLTCPRDKFFAMRNGTISGAENVHAISSFGIWHDYLYSVFQRVLIATALIVIIMIIVFNTVLQRFLLQSLDDLFVQLYGNAVLDANHAVTDKKSLQAKLASFQERMRSHVDEQARLASLGAGASFLAHDMRNLLASLQLNAEQLMQMPETNQRRIGERLSAAIGQALSLTEWAALYTSKKREDLNVDRQKLAPIITDALDFVRLHDPHRRVRLINECGDDVEVVAEPTLMFRIIYNLVLNSMQAMKGRKGRQNIRVEARSDDEQCTMYISDNGPGLPKNGQGDLLMPQPPGAHRPTSTGLGLKIVTDLVSWHGGKIDVVRADEHGTHFKLILPHQTPGARRDTAVVDDRSVEE